MTEIMIGVAVIIIVIFLIAIKFSVYRHHSPDSDIEERGKQGELEVAALLTSIAQPQDIVMNDVILFNAHNGKSSQIDHIFITSSGVYVIETKNYSGYIYGKEHEQKWTEAFPNGTKNQFHSPAKQNNTHLYLLRKIIGDKIPMKGFIVFTNGDIKHVDCPNVIDLSELEDYLSSPREVLLSAEDIQTIRNKILQNRDTYRVSKEEHLANIKKTQVALEERICPRCGKQLVLRSGKYGDFYGCSGYPSCKFTMKNNQGDKS